MPQDRDRASLDAPTELEKMFISLNDLRLRSQELLAEGMVTLEDARLLSRSVTEVRALLDELARLEVGLQRTPHLQAMLGDLQELYWGLEGMVKEARNSLDREHRGI